MHIVNMALKSASTVDSCNGWSTKNRALPFAMQTVPKFGSANSFPIWLQSDKSQPDNAAHFKY